MSKKTAVLNLFGHELLPAEKREGSVLRWKCQNCGRKHEDPVAYDSEPCRNS